MGSHIWTEQCPYCGFEEAAVSSNGSLYFEMTCQICGYSIWTEGRVPNTHNVERAKKALSKMNTEEKQKAIELYSEDNIPLVDRLKGESLNEELGDNK
jgi:DNA-directed RNA polymerase subunit RPC12/RpoP